MQTIDLEYDIYPIPRYGYGKPVHEKLYEIINNNRDAYRKHLNSFLKYKTDLTTISNVVDNDSDSKNIEPTWANLYFSGLDAIALYGFLCEYNPVRYFEIGSGNSTKFARRAIKDHNLDTIITSIDPFPRAEVDIICDNIIRQPVENVNIDIFNSLKSGDILFIDGTHRLFMNSDVSTIFLDIIPNLRPGVIVHMHDIFLPFDYPSEWIQRYYSEQYMLAIYLLSGGGKIDIILPNNFISNDDELNKIMSNIFSTDDMTMTNVKGVSCWFVIRN